MRISILQDGFEDIREFTYVYKRDVYRRRSNYYKFNISCCVCNGSYFTRTNLPSKWCSNKCAMLDNEVRQKLSNANKGNRKSKEECAKIALRKSKGGVVDSNTPLFDTYANQICFVEEVIPTLNNGGIKTMSVRCIKCGNWFTPSRTQVENRAQFLKGNTDREGRFYCSDVCKATCSIYKKKKYPVGKNPRKSRNIVNESSLRVWSKEVLKRANNSCEYCGGIATTAHHIKPKKLEPFLALDPVNGIACCDVCHYKYGHRGECSTVVLANYEC